MMWMSQFQITRKWFVVSKRQNKERKSIMAGVKMNLLQLISKRGLFKLF